MAKNNKEYEFAIKIAGEIEKSFYESTKLTKKELSDLAKEAVRAASATEKATPAAGAISASLKKGLDDAAPVFSSLETAAKTSFKAIAAAAATTGAAVVAGLGASFSAGVEFESAFMGVEKTVNATDAELAQLRGDIREMSKEMPTSAAGLSEIAESAGQLGIQTENIAEFTRTMADLDVATNLSSEEGAAQMAQYANITGMAQDKFDELGSTIVDLGNNMATTEADIMNMGMRIAAAGSQVELSQDEIMGYAAALSSVGIEAEAGGTAFSKLLTNLQMAAETGADLEAYAQVAGMTGRQFKEAFEEDASTAINAFLQGLNDTERNGKSAIAILNEMGLTEVRLRDTLLRASNASDLVADALDIANEAWEENTALTNEAAKRYSTVESQMDIFGNKVTDIGISLYDDMRPGVLAVIDLGNELIDSVAGQEDAIGGMIENAVEKMPTMVREVKEAGKAVGDFAQPFLAVGGWLVENPGLLVGTITGIGSALAAYKVASGIASLATSLGALGPVGWGIMAVGGVAGVITGIGTAVKKSAETAKKANLDAHFGDIALSMEDLEEVAGHILKSKELDQVREALGAFNELEGLDENISSTVEELNKASWKVSIGMEMTDAEEEEYRASLESFISDTQEYVTQRQYAINLAVGVLTDDDLEGSNIINQVNQFYADKQQELADLGTQLNNTITEAFQDGLLDIDEVQEITELQQQMAKIQSALASSEFEANLNLLGMKYAGGQLDAESFQNLQAELKEQTEAAIADYDEAYTLSVANAKVMLQEGALDQSGYDSMIAELEENYRQQVGEIQVNAVDFQTQTILQQYSDELGEIMQQMPDKVNSVMEETLEYVNFSENAVGGWDAENLLDSIEIEGLSSDTKAAIEELWGELSEQLPQMQELANQYAEAGQKIPEYLSQGISEASALGIIAGDQEAIYSALGEAARNSEEYQATLEEMEEQGWYIPEAISKAIEENTADVELGINALYQSTKEAIDDTFGKGFNVNIPISASPISYYKDPGKTAEDIGGHAEGGIFSTPHIAWFAENGPEAAIPLDGSQNAINLWLRTGELLNMPGLMGDGQSFSEGIEAAAYYGGHNSEMQISYSPVNYFYGNATQEDVEAVLETDQERFARMMNEYMKNNRRFNFGG